MSASRVSSVEAALEDQRFGPLQLRVAVLCGLAQLFDGYDLSAIGMAAPAMSQAWGVPAASFAAAFVMSSVGMMVGVMLSGPLGDRLGRKPVIVGSLLIVGVFSLATVWASTLGELAILRFLTGIGIGGVMPSTVALNADYTSHRLRATVVMFMFTGNTLGGFIGGQVIAQTLPHFGWRVIFVIGGIIPLVLVPFLLVWLPESVRFLLARGQNSARALRVYAALGIEPATAHGSMRESVDVASGNPVRALFSADLAARTILLWVMFLANLLSMYLISYWLPTVLHLSGLSPADAVFAASMMSAGAVLSTLLLGWLATRFGARRVLTVSFGTGALVIAAIGLLPLSHDVLLVAIFLMGGCTVGSQLAANGFAAALYPARIRTTGVGWALGVGRLGGIGGPALGGLLLGMGWPPRQIFLCACVTAIIAATCTVLLGLGRRDAPLRTETAA